MRFCNPGFYLSRLIHFRLVSDRDDFVNDGGPTQKRRAIKSITQALTQPLRRRYIPVNARYTQSRHSAFLVYPTFPLAQQQTTPRMALNMATEQVEERPFADVPTLPINAPRKDPARTQKIAKVWRRTNGGMPQEVVTFHGEY